MACCKFNVVTKTAAYTATERDDVILMDNSSGNLTLTLPTAVGIRGKRYFVTQMGSSAYTVTIDGNGSQTISGQTTIVLYTKYHAVEIVSDNANWHIISSQVMTANSVGFSQQYFMDIATSISAFSINWLTGIVLDPVAGHSTYSISSNQNNLALTYPSTVHRISSDASRNITGFDAAGIGSSNFAILVNGGSFDWVLVNQDSGSSAANRIITGSGANLTVTPDDAVIIWYDPTSTRWRVVAKNV